ERADARPARRAVRLPGSEGGVDVERALREVDVRVRRADVQARRDLAPFQGEDRLDQAGDPRSGVEMADVRLDRAHREEPPAPGAGPEGPGQGRDLDRIAQR